MIQISSTEKNEFVIFEEMPLKYIDSKNKKQKI